MEKLPESITEWLKKLGLKVNHDKTDLCLIHKQETTTIRINYVSSQD
jgi:ATP phosphoribosyltransferase